MEALQILVSGALIGTALFIAYMVATYRPKLSYCEVRCPPCEARAIIAAQEKDGFKIVTVFEYEGMVTIIARSHE